MLQKLRSTNNQGFTLIELMIVIAIIGILAAIAIPNFIAYRNKTFCSATESDANSIASAIADYFSIPTNTSVTDASLMAENSGQTKVYVGDTMSNNNTWHIEAGNLDAIEIQVTDASTRCPEDYQSAMSNSANPRGYWDDGVYIKTMRMN